MTSHFIVDQKCGRLFLIFGVVRHTACTTNVFFQNPKGTTVQSSAGLFDSTQKIIFTFLSVCLRFLPKGLQRNFYAT